jgi:hypothetical protein
VNAGVIRGILLLAAVVIGAIVISGGFPSTGAPPPSSQSSSPTPTSHPTSSPTPSAHPLTCPSTSGVRVAVENATNTPGLAAATASRVKAAGYTVNPSTDIGDATVKTATSTVFYRTPADKLAARCLKKTIFPPAALKSMSAGGTSASPRFSTAAGVAIFVGTDYATAHPVH